MYWVVKVLLRPHMALVMLILGDTCAGASISKGFNMKSKSGFTLVEIAVTVSIIGLLAALGALVVLKAHRNALRSQAETELQILSSATLQLVHDTSFWPNKARRINPTSTEVWNISVAAAGLMDSDGNYPNWKGPYYEGPILDPWGSPYFFDPDYRINGVDRIVVGSFGPNRVGRNLYDSDDIIVYLDD